ncbi:hypothetical protein EI94DRAFT_1732689 [Lactarius quietus]|nr:hypothetical protein EI94DRAFT_1732689 [Lactarius quietus]
MIVLVVLPSSVEFPPPQDRPASSRAPLRVIIMITPRFSCSQNDRSVVVSVYCPAVRASEIEINVSDTLLSLHVAPYFLRLNFPAGLVEDDQSSAVYDPASGYLTLTLTKQNSGESFPDLDLLGKLLAPPPQTTPRGPAIEVLSTQDTPDEFLEAAANDWTIPQTVPDTLPVLETSVQKPYGFLNAYTGYFRHVGTTENEINELGTDAETLSPLERRTRRVQHEDSKWDPEHYIVCRDVVFTEAENATMLRLPRREYIASPPETRALHLTLLTLLFSYAYDARMTQHDPTPESAWTLASWALAEACRADAARLLARGTRTVLRCLLELRAILDAHEVYYVYSRIWLDDFCRWVQACARYGA